MAINCWSLYSLLEVVFMSLGHLLCLLSSVISINTLRPRRDEQHFADDIFKRIFFNENVWISIKISLKFVPKGPINNIPALVQIMAWRRLGDKPLSEPMMASLPTHICVTRPQRVKLKGSRQGAWLCIVLFDRRYPPMSSPLGWKALDKALDCALCYLTVAIR